MKNSTLMRGLLGASALMAFSTGSAFAQDNDFTAAGELVQNTFTLSYEVNNVGQDPITNDAPGQETVFRVDRLVNVTVDSSGTPGAFSPDQQNAVVEFSVRNNGNDTHAYLLDFEEVVNGTGDDDFDTENSTNGSRIIYYEDTNGDGILNNSEGNTPITYDPATPSTWPVIAPDGSIIVQVVRDIPATATDGQQADIHLYADTRDQADPAGTPIEADPDGVNDTNATENVLADANGPASDGLDGDTDGAHSATNTYLVLAADVSATKDVFVLNDDYNGLCPVIDAATYTPPRPSAETTAPVPNNGYHRPLACVEYFITVQNDGSADATAIDLTDILPSGLVFRSAALIGGLQPGTLTVPAAGTECDPTGTPNCIVRLLNGSIAGNGGGAPTEGHLIIRASVK